MKELFPLPSSLSRLPLKMERTKEAGDRDKHFPRAAALLVGLAAIATFIGVRLWRHDQPDSVLEGRPSDLESRKYSGLLDSDGPQLGSERVDAFASREGQAKEAIATASSWPKSPADEERIGYYADDMARRISVVSEKEAGFVLSHLSPEFCQMYLAECAQLSMAPEAPLGEVISPPDLRTIRELFAREDAGQVVLENRKLTDLFERVRGFATVELKANRGEVPHTSMERHIAEFSSFVASFGSGKEFMAAAGEYGQSVLEEDAKVGESTLDDKELRLTALLWEERCRKENQMIGTLPREVRFWFHVTRVMARYVYDDSYWLSPDELSAAEKIYPDHLQTR